MKSEYKKTILALIIIALVVIAFILFFIKSNNTAKENALETAKKSFNSISSSTFNNETESNDEKITECKEETSKYTETTNDTTINNFDIEKLKKQSDDIFINSIGQKYYLIKADGTIAFNTFLDTSKKTDDIIEQIISGITLCWSNYCVDNYSIMSFMFFDLDGNNVCYYTLTNMFGNFSDLGNDIVWTEKYQQYQEVYNNSTYRDYLNIFEPKNQ